MKFTENVKGLVFENTLIFSDIEPEKIFLNPFELLDNSTKYLDILQTTTENFIMENEESRDDALSGMITSLLKITNYIAKPIFDYAKSQITSENINAAKEKVIELVQEQLEKHENMIMKSEPDSDKYKEEKKIVAKLEYLKKLTGWSMGKEVSSMFKFYHFS